MSAGFHEPERRLAWCVALVLPCVLACRDDDPAPRSLAAASGTSIAEATGTPGQVPPVPSTGSSESSQEPARIATSATRDPVVARCPEGMQHITGGLFWIGREGPFGNPEEHPRHQSRVHDYCLDRTEVTSARYKTCVESGDCSAPKKTGVTCNYDKSDRADHPINCVTWQQAVDYCESRDARLPTEREWEYAARGGEEYRKYSWGDEPPDGRTCWKRPYSCPVATHAEGAFGLHDMNGNVWEWTATYFGDYPWPASEGTTRVYRGGSWSRRFEKWMSLTLRNRFAPDRAGSHLGFRCATLLASTDCPYGKEGQYCRYGVEAVPCERSTRWNGVRCAKAGEPRCRDHEEEVPGHGCVRQTGRGVSTTGATKRGERSSIDDVTMRRDPKFDVDCRKYNPKRPTAWRLEDGSHVLRNRVGRGKGCKNRDVGVGWNSVCCP